MPQEKDFIWELAGGYPIFVQMAGHYLLDGRAQGLSGDALTKFAVSSFDQQAEAHYTYLWSHCSESEKITLLILLTLGMQKPTKKTIPNMENLTRLRARAPQDLVALGKRGMVVENDELYRLFSPSLERWVRQEIVASPGEEETETTADEWLKSGKRDDLKEVKNVLPKFKKKYWPLLGNIAKELSFEFATAGAFELIKVLM
jgi:hypothetical protein